MQYCFIVNPTAGKGQGSKVIDEINTFLKNRNAIYKIEVTQYAGHGVLLTQKAIEAGYEVVVSVGGDGTMNEVLNGIGETGTTMGIIPIGTGNDLARTLGIPLSLEQSLEVVVHGNTVGIDLGKERDNYFSIITGIGFPSDVMHHVNTTPSFFKGPLKIFAGIIKTMNKLKPYPVTIRTVEKTFKSDVMGIFILNCRFTGGGLMIAPEADHKDGLFDVVLMHRMSKFSFLRLLPKAYSGRHMGHPKVELFRTSKITVESDEPLMKIVDGNVLGLTPLDAHVIPKGLSVIIPKE